MFSNGIQRKLSCLGRNLFITHYVCNSMVQRKFTLNGQHYKEVVNRRKKNAYLVLKEVKQIINQLYKLLQSKASSLLMINI
jgi:hypothetical protein